MIIMIGIIITFVLVGQTYESHEEQTTLLHSLHSTDYLYATIIHPSNPFVTSSGLIDYTLLNSSESIDFITNLQKEYNSIGLNFSLHFSFLNTSFWYPKEPQQSTQRIAVSHEIGLSLNMVSTTRSTLNIAIWNMDDKNSRG